MAKADTNNLGRAASVEALDGKMEIYDPALNHALEVIYGINGDSCLIKNKDLVKFGGNTSVGTTEKTLMGLQGSEVRETYATTNSVDSLICTDDTFTGNIKIEGHYLSGTDKVFHVQTIAATGQTRAALTQPLCRATRAYIPGSTGFATPASDVAYIYDSTVATTPASGVPNVASATKLILDGYENTSAKAATTISFQDYAIITKLTFSCRKKANADVTLRFRTRTGTNVFRTKTAPLYLATDAAQSLVVNFLPYLIIEPNSDIELTALGSTTGITVTGGFDCFLALVQ